MTLEQLQYFCDIAEQLNFTRAAELLFISQPTLSRQISLLEREVGAVLLQRDTRRVTLTPAGRLVYQSFKEILERLNRMQQDIWNMTNNIEGSFRVASINFFYPELYDIYRRYSTMYPNVDFSIQKYDNGLFTNMVANGEVDLGVGFSFDLPADPSSIGLEVMPLYEERFVVVMSNQNKLAGLRTVTLDQIRGERLLFLAQLQPPMMQSIWLQTNLENALNNSVKKENIESLLLQIKADNRCCSIVPFPITHLMPTGCTVAEIAGLDSRFRIVMAWQKERQSPVLSAFLDIARSGFAAGPFPSPLR